MTDVFTDLRPRLFGVAYRMLGSVADAEDVVQDTWIAWQTVDAESVDNLGAYLTRAVTRRALNRLRQVRRQREAYVGPWLPEPLDTSRRPEEAAEVAESVSYALMVLLEQLTPAQRAAFVLTEAFGMPAPEVAEALSSTPAAIRQHLARARRQLREREDPPKPVDDSEFERVSTAFLAALTTGDLVTATRLLAPDVVLTTDGGGVKRAALRPIYGPDKVLRFLLGLLEQYGVADRPDAGMEVKRLEVNGRPGLVIDLAGELNAVQFDIAEGHIRAAWVVRNPAKLSDVAPRR